MQVSHTLAAARSQSKGTCRKMASGYDGHATKRQRTDVDGHGIQSGKRVSALKCPRSIVDYFAFHRLSVRCLFSPGHQTKVAGESQCRRLHVDVGCCLRKWRGSRGRYPYLSRLMWPYSSTESKYMDPKTTQWS